MGVVYEAEQISIGRRVALKVLPFAAMLDKQQLARFKNEARAAGTLDHPNIVAIHSVGCERGVHYYAMQLIEGRSLAQIIAEMKPGRPPSPEEHAPAVLTHPPAAADTAEAALPTVQDRGSAVFSSLHAPRSTLLDPSSREFFFALARLGIQAAEALDHAHQNGILHRDIKPANLLVDDAGKLWITDFGLARIEQDAGMTMTGDILGTLRYMSPEQALAKRVVVDHRSDIYSLGITLYELLTHQPAFTGNDRQELLRQIAFDEPRKPRQIIPRIPHDLETIVLKAIEKQPADRYATANELAADLRRLLQSEPIKAKPAGLLQRLLKWSRRHVAALWAFAAVFLLTTLVLLGAAVQIARSYREAERQRGIADSRLKEAERQRDTADAVSNLIQEMLSAADPEAAKGADYTVRQLMDGFAANFNDQLIDQPEVEIKLRDILGGAYHSLRLFEQSDSQFQRAFQVLRTKLPEDSLAFAEILESYAATAHDLGRTSEAIACLEQAFSIYQREDAPARSLGALSLLHGYRVNSNDFEAADAIAAEYRRIAGELGNIETSPNMLRSIGVSYLRRGRIAEAESVLRQAADLYRRKKGNMHPDTAWGLSVLSFALERQGKLDDAVAAQREAHTISRAVHGTDSPSFQYLASRTAVLLNAQEKSSEALALVAEILAGYDERVRRKSISAEDCAALAWNLIVGKLDDFASGGRAVEIATKACELTDYKDPSLLDGLAAACAANGDFKLAVQWSEKALELTTDPAKRARFAEHLKAVQDGKLWWSKSRPDSSAPPVSTTVPIPKTEL
jgi:serine/threonine protein kinase